MSLFITFEGGEGSGKSYQANRLYDRLRQLSVPVVLTCEPGGTPLGMKLEKWLKWHDDIEVTPLAELMLFNAARAQQVASIIQPNLAKGRVVISDRYADSTTVYQGYGRGLELENVKSVNRAATGGLVPDITILLDLAASEWQERRRGCRLDRFEKEDLEYHQRVRDGYLALAAAEPERWLIMDASLTKDQIAAEIWDKVSTRLPQSTTPDK